MAVSCTTMEMRRRTSSGCCATSLAQTPGVNSFDRFNVSPRAIRLHVGLEDAEMLWADLENALAKSVK